MGKSPKRTSSTAVSAQNCHRGRSSSEKPETYSTAPPRAPTSKNHRGSPSARRSKKTKAAAPTARVYPPSSTGAQRRNRRRKGRRKS